jgi:LPS O-antigen subunit length determinant protein (WzzB/FepE family)
MERDEIYLMDVWAIFVREWRWFLAALAFSLLVTFMLTRLLGNQWEATAWIRIAQVGVVPSGEDPKVEPLLRVIERLNLESFENEVMKSAGFSPDARASKLYRATLELRPMPYAGPLIRLSLRADSPQLAKRLAEATVARLSMLHRRLEAEPLAHARQRLRQVQDDLRDAMAERDRLMKSAAANAARKGSVSDATLASVLLNGKQQEIRNLQAAISDLTTRLSPAYTYGTSLMWPVYVPRKPAFPNRALMWTIGAVVGIGLGAFAATARNALRRRARQPARASNPVVA